MIEDPILNLFKREDESSVVGSIRVSDGYAYASDAFMLCARKSREGEVDDGFQGVPPRIASIIDTIDANLNKCCEAMPDLNIQLCAKCVGAKVRCHGSGFSSIECDCDGCNGEGYVGDGFKDGYILVAGREIRIWSAVVLSWIKDVRITPIHFSDVDLGSIVFRFGEYKGIVLGKKEGKVD